MAGWYFHLKLAALWCGILQLIFNPLISVLGTFLHGNFLLWVALMVVFTRYFTHVEFDSIVGRISTDLNTTAEHMTSNAVTRNGGSAL